MKQRGRRRWVRGLAAGLLALLLGLLGAGWLGWQRGAAYVEGRVRQAVRQALTGHSRLVLAPFRVRLSPWRDFPYPSLTISQVALTDTSHGRAVRVLAVGQAEARLDLPLLLRERRIEIRRLRVTDVYLGQRVDSLGRSWGLRGAQRTAATQVPTATVQLDSILVENLQLETVNDYIKSALRGRVARGQGRASLRGGVLRVQGRFEGELQQLRNRTGDLLRHEPVRVWLGYRYFFAERRGEFDHARGTLRGDTIRLTGGHRADTAAVPRGTVLDLRFAGRQPLLPVLRVALPPSLRGFWARARSASRGQVEYRIQGLSGPRVRARVRLGFDVRGARVQWPEPGRRIDSWDLAGTFDNGPAHLPQTMSLTLSKCRIYSPVGQLDVAFRAEDFSRPRVRGRLRGRTTLPSLAALVGAPAGWQARAGTADLDLRLRAQLPPAGPPPGARRPGGRPRRSLMARTRLSLRGTATLQGAAFELGPNRPDLHDLTVRLGLADSVWHLSRASGELAGMRFRAELTARHLFDYLTGQHPTTALRGAVRVNRLDLPALRALLRPAAPGEVAARLRASPARKPRPSRAARQQMAATLGRRFLPPGLRFDLRLRCGALPLATDTLRQLAARVRHDGERVQLSDLAGQVLGGRLTGQAEWPTDPDNPVAPVSYQLGFRFDTLRYDYLLARLTRPPRRPPGPRPGSPALRELLLAANGQFTYAVGALRLPDGEQLRDLHLRFEKQGNVLLLNDVEFVAPQGGVGRGSATATLDGLRLTGADATLDLRYAQLDVPRLLRLLASVAPPTPRDSVGRAQRAQRRAQRAARRAAAGTSPQSVFVNGTFTALLRVRADAVRYAALQGTNFELLSRVRAGEATVENCTLNALDGRLTLRGRLRTDAGPAHHPLRAQLLLEDIDLSQLFAIAADLRPRLPGADNVRGRLRAAAALRTDFDERFLAELDQTSAYLKADLRGLELVDVEALREAFKLRPLQRRAARLLFEPVSGEFFLSRGELLVPDLQLNSNLTQLEVSGRFGLDGRSDFFLGLSPWQALLGNNRRRLQRLEAGEPVRRRPGRLTYLRLRRELPRTKYRVSVFQKPEQRRAQAQLRQHCRQLVQTQRLDTTLRLLPPLPPGLSTLGR